MVVILPISVSSCVVSIRDTTEICPRGLLIKYAKEASQYVPVTTVGLFISHMITLNPDLQRRATARIPWKVGIGRGRVSVNVQYVVLCIVVTSFPKTELHCFNTRFVLGPSSLVVYM